MGQCESIQYDSDGKIVEQCQLGNMHDGEHRYEIQICPSKVMQQIIQERDIQFITRKA